MRSLWRLVTTTNKRGKKLLAVGQTDKRMDKEGGCCPSLHSCCLQRCKMRLWATYKNSMGVRECFSSFTSLLQCPLHTASPVMVSAVELGKQEWENWQSPLTPLPGVEHTFHLHQSHQQEEHMRTGELKHLGHSNYIFKALGDLDSCVSPDESGLCSPVHKRHILKPF